MAKKNDWNALIDAELQATAGKDKTPTKKDWGTLVDTELRKQSNVARPEEPKVNAVEEPEEDRQRLALEMAMGNFDMKMDHLGREIEKVDRTINTYKTSIPEKPKVKVAEDASEAYATRKREEAWNRANQEAIKEHLDKTIGEWAKPEIQSSTYFLADRKSELASTVGASYDNLRTKAEHQAKRIADAYIAENPHLESWRSMYEQYLTGEIYGDTYDKLIRTDKQFYLDAFEDATGMSYEAYLKDRAEEIKKRVKALKIEAEKTGYDEAHARSINDLMHNNTQGDLRIPALEAKAGEKLASMPYEELLEKIEAWEKNSFASGFKSGFDAIDFFSLGLADMLNSSNINSVLDKAYKGETLYGNDKRLYELWQLQNEIESYRDIIYDKQSLWSSIGEGVGTSAEMLPEFAVSMAGTGGVASFAKLGGKAALQSALKAGGKELAGYALKTTGKLAYNYGLAKVRGGIASPFMTSTYNQYLQNLNSGYKIDEDGELKYEPIDKSKAYFGAMISTANEISSEYIGLGISKVVGLGGRTLGRVVGNTKLSQLSKPLTRWLPKLSPQAKKAMLTVGVQADPISEALSEGWGDIMTAYEQSLIGLKVDAEQFATFDYWATLFGVSLVYGGALSTVGGAITYKQVKDAVAQRDKIVGEISNRALQNQLLAITSADNVMLESSALADIDWESIKDERDLSLASAFIVADLNVKILTGAVEENARLQNFQGTIEKMRGFVYQKSAGEYEDLIQEAELEDGTKVYVINGLDADNATGLLTVVDATTGEKSSVAIDKVSLGETYTVDQYILNAYNEQFSLEIEQKRVEDIRAKAIEMTNPTKKDVGRVASMLNINLPKIGATVMLSNGAMAVVSEELSPAEYAVKTVDGATYKVHFTDILSTDAITAKAQSNIANGTTIELVTPEATTEDITPEEPISEDITPEETISEETITEETTNNNTKVTIDGREGTIAGTNADGSMYLVAFDNNGIEDTEAYTKEEIEAAMGTTTTPQSKSTITEVATTEDGQVDTDMLPAPDAAKAIVAKVGSIEAAIEGVKEVMAGVAEERKAASKAQKKTSLNDIGKTSEEVQALDAQLAHHGEVLAELEKMLTEQTAQAETKATTPSEGVTNAETTPAETKNTTEAKPEPIGVIRNETAMKFTDKILNLVDTIGKRLGLTIEFVDNLTDANGQLVNGDIVGKKIRLSATSHKGIKFIIGHEFFHRIKDIVTPEQYVQFVDSVKEFIGEEQWNNALEYRRRVYRNHNAKIVKEALAEKSDEEIIEIAESLGIKVDDVSPKDLVQLVINMAVDKVVTKPNSGVEITEETPSKPSSLLPNLVRLTEELCVEETVADFAGEMVNNTGVFTDYAESISTNSSLLRALRKAIRSVKEFFKSQGYTDNQKKLVKMENTLTELLSVAVATEANGKTNKGTGKDRKSITEANTPSLVGVHNISLDKLRKVIKMGGLANPSVAVIDVDKQTHDDYGEYSLILPKNMVDARQGKNAGTWAGDAWTPTYPQVIKRMKDDKSYSRFRKDIEALPEAMRNKVRLEFDNFMEGRSADPLTYWYLFEKGTAPELVLVPSRYSDEVANAISEATKGSFSMYGLTPEERAKCLEVYIAVKFNGDKTAFENDLQERIARLTETIETKKSDRVKKWAQSNIDAIKEYGFDYDSVADFIRDVQYDVREKGTVNVDATIIAAREQIKANNLETDYEAWLNGLEERYGIEEYIFDGYTNSGNRRYLPHTVENASKWMKKQGRQGAVGTFPSFGIFVAVSIPKMTTLEDIRKRKASLGKSKEEYDAFREKWENVYYELGKKLQPDAKGFDDYGYWRLIEAVGHNNPKEFIKKQYNIELSEEDMTMFNDMVNAIRTEYPARYFETKFERPLQLSDFTAAVVPNDIPLDVESRLKEAGVEVIEYEKGDNASRAEAMQKASAMENVRFSLQETNDRFNAELAMQISGTLPKGHIYKLGMPSYILRDAGIPNLPIELAASRLVDKSMQENHPFDLDEVKDLPFAIHLPLAVFRSATHIGSNVILTELKHNGKSFVVAVETNRQAGKLFVNSIRSVHYRTDMNIINWINDGLADYIKPTFEQEWLAPTKNKLLSQPQYNSVDVRKKLNDVTKIIKDFPNPKISAKFSLITPEMDADYLSAVERGDMATAKQMVMEAAKLAMPNTKVVDEDGNPKVVYHGTPNNFNAFSKEMFGTSTDRGIWGNGFYFSDSEQYAKTYEKRGDKQGRTLTVFLNIENPLFISLRNGGNEGAMYFHELMEKHFTDDIYEDATRTDELMSVAQERLTADIMANGYDGIVVEYTNHIDTEYVAFNPNQIKSADPVTYDDAGNIIPLSERFNPDQEDIRYSIQAPTFYSNAQYAVQNIKQDKATPEQWLKMIEKNGGLKAGEDKWIGLSDWLKASDKKALTKDEVLQYIAENDIQIEEVSYGDVADISREDIYESAEFAALREDLTEYDEDDNPYINRERYDELRSESYDFVDGFSLDYWGEELEVNSPAAAATYLGLPNSDREINETRLNYTTQGLSNKREIALVVPTIEPWNTSDEIHFGDAGEGRAVAWIRFGDTIVQEPHNYSPEVAEWHEPYKNVNNEDVFKPKGGAGKDAYVVHRQRKDAEGYIIFIKDKPISIHTTLEEARIALNGYYKQNPLKLRKNKYVLVIDEIQSKRHQDGREKGYSNRSVSQQELYEAQEAAFSKVIDYESALADKYGEDEWAALATAEEMAEYERLRALDEAATNAYENYDKGVPSAPFEKNWAELAFKRMLRYAAENGYDYVAWTTGDQQADRYDIGSVVKDIVTYDTKDADGNPIKKMKFRMNNMGTYNIATNVEGVIVKGDGEMKEGMHLSDITGKPLAEKIMNGEGEDAMVFENGKDIEAKSLEGEELHIGNEGMKAFYDQMLPSFVKKYTKKWGAEVGEVTMPDLEENNTMHAVNVTDSMRESVMQGQPRFSLIGEKGALSLENNNPAGARLRDLNIARQMEKRGDDALNIKVATGWERGVDGLWRYEIDDMVAASNINKLYEHNGDKAQHLVRRANEEKSIVQAMYDGIFNINEEVRNSPSRTYEERIRSIYNRYKDASKMELLNTINELSEKINTLKNVGSAFALEDVISSNHPIFAAYPEMRSVGVITTKDNGGETRGSYNWRNNTITISIYTGDIEAEAATLVHEMQHAIQHIEGFATGGMVGGLNPHAVAKKKVLIDEYTKKNEDVKKRKSELEARNVEIAKALNEWKNTRQEGSETPADIQSMINEESANKNAISALRSESRRLERNIDELKEMDTRYSYDDYLRIAGEVEARTVAKRNRYTSEQRRNTLAVNDSYIAPEYRILVHKGDIMSPKYSLDNIETERFNRKVNFIKDAVREYNIPNPVFIAETKEEFVQMVKDYGGEVGDDTAEIYGMYIPNDDIILLNGGKLITSGDAHRGTMHEYAHSITKKYLGERLVEITSSISEAEIDKARKEMLPEAYRDYSYSEVIDEFTSLLLEDLSMAETRAIFEGEMAVDTFIEKLKNDIKGIEKISNKDILYAVIPLVVDNLKIQKEQYGKDREQTIVIPRVDSRRNPTFSQTSHLSGDKKSRPSEAESRVYEAGRGGEGSQKEAVAPRYSIPDPDPSEAFYDDMPIYDEQGREIDITTLSSEEAKAVLDSKVRQMLEAEYNHNVVTIRREANEARAAINARYREEKIKRRDGHNAAHTNAAKIDEIFGDKTFESLPYEVQALILIATGQAKIYWSDRGSNRGLASELGLTGSKGDRHAYRNIWGGAKKSFNEVVHEWWESIGGQEKGIDDNDLRNALISALQSVQSSKDAMQELINNFDDLTIERDRNLADTDHYEEQELRKAKDAYEHYSANFELSEGEERKAYHDRAAQYFGNQSLFVVDELVEKLTAENERNKLEIERLKAENKDMYTPLAEGIAKSKEIILHALERLRMFAGMEEVDLNDVARLINMVKSARSQRQVEILSSQAQNLVQRVSIKKAKTNLGRLLSLKLSNPDIIRRVLQNTEAWPQQERESMLKHLWKVSRNGLRVSKAVHPDTRAIIDELRDIVSRYKKGNEVERAKILHEMEVRIDPNIDPIEKEREFKDWAEENKQAAFILFKAYSEVLAKDTAFKVASSKVSDMMKNGVKDSSLAEAIEDKRVKGQEYLNALTLLNQNLESLIVNGKEDIRAFYTNKEEHAKEIRHMGIEAVGGDKARLLPDVNPEGKAKAISALQKVNAVKNATVNAPYWTFDTVLTKIDRAGKNGKFYKFFMNKWQNSNTEFLNRQRKHAERIAQKMRDCFPNIGKRKSAYNLITKITRKADETLLPTTVTYKNNDGKIETQRLTISSGMYTIAMWRQPRYRAVMEAHGITQTAIDRIYMEISEIDAGYIKFMDWVNFTLLPDTRLEYDVVHRALYGGSMAKEVNYFPANVLHYEEVKLDEKTGLGNISLSPSALKERTSTNAMPNLTMNYFKVLEAHLQNMDEWASFEELRVDLSTLLSSKEFKNRLIALQPGIHADGTGAGGLYDNFFKTSKIATGLYQTDYNKVQSWILKAQKNWVAANIAYRFWTGLKQLSSIPIFAFYQANDPKSYWYFAKALAKGINPFGSVKRAMNLSPSMRQRWESRFAGLDSLMRETNKEKEIAVYRGLGKRTWNAVTDFVDFLSRFGMGFNAIMDVTACAVGVNMIYDYEINKATEGKREATEEEKRDAIRKAEYAFNSTQQSSEAAYMSVMQLEPALAMYTAYKNASMAAHRKRSAGLEELWDIVTSKEYREFLREELGEDGVKIARGTAISDILQGFICDVGFTFMGTYGGMLLFSLLFDRNDDDDDDDREKYWDDFVKDAGLSMLNGYAFGGLAGEIWGSGTVTFNPALDELKQKIERIADNKGNAWLDTTLLMFQFGLGADLKTFYNIASGFENRFFEEEDGDYAGAWLKALNAPQGYLKAFVGDRRDGETAEEYMVRIIRLNSILTDVKYSDYYDEEGRYIGDGAPSFGMTKKQAQNLRREYEAAYAKNILIRKDGIEAYNSYVEATKKHAQICELLGFNTDTHPSDEKAEQSDLHWDMAYYQDYVADIIKDRKEWIGDDDYYYDLLKDEQNEKNEFINSYYEYIKQSGLGAY